MPVPRRRVGQEETAGQRGERTGPSAAGGMRRQQKEVHEDAEISKLIDLYKDLGEKESDGD